MGICFGFVMPSPHLSRRTLPRRNVSHTVAIAGELSQHALLIIEESFLSDEWPVTTTALFSHARYTKSVKAHS